MEKIFETLNELSDLIAAPFGWGSATFKLAVVSFICAFFLLLFFKHLSNQAKIKLHRNKIFGYFLEIGIYRDQFSRTISSQVKILKHTLIYLRYVLPPFLLMMIPVIIICIQIDSRLGYLPIQMNQSFIIHTGLDSEISSCKRSNLAKLQCETSAGILLETPPLRIEPNGSVFWRARLTEDGPQSVKVKVEDSQDVVEKKIITVNHRERFTSIKMKANALAYLWNSAETPIPAGSCFAFLAINYLPATYPLFFWNISPVIYFFILSLLFALILKTFLKVNI